MITQQQTGIRPYPGGRSIFTALAAAAMVALFGGHAVAEHAGLGAAGEQRVDPAVELYNTQNRVEGKLSIAGSDTMKPVISKLAAQFLSLHPGAEIAVEGVGSGAAIREFQLGISYQRRGDKVRGRGTNRTTAWIRSKTCLVLCRHMMPPYELMDAMLNRQAHESQGMVVVISYY